MVFGVLVMLWVSLLVRWLKEVCVIVCMVLVVLLVSVFWMILLSMEFRLRVYMLGVMYSKDSMRKVGEIWFLIMSIFLDFCVDEFDDNWKE